MTVKRITIEVTDQQQKRLKAMASLNGQSIKDFVLSSTLGTGDELAALEELEALLEKRLADAREGGVSGKHVRDVIDELKQSTGAKKRDA